MKWIRSKRRDKGQSILAKPIVLVMIIALLSFLIFFMLQQQGGLEQRSSQLDLLSTTSDTLSLLIHSPRCLSYQPEEGGAYGSTVSAEKLRNYEIKYPNSEPPCARNFLYGWRAQVKDLITNRSWQFGAQDFSKQKALKSSETRQMSISIHYAPERVNPGLIRLTMVNGELERIGEKINYLCASDAASGQISFYNSYPVEVEDDRVCMTFSRNQSCRSLLCQVDMPQVKSEGEHLLRVNVKGKTKGDRGTSGISKTDKTAKEIILRQSDLSPDSQLDLGQSQTEFDMSYGQTNIKIKTAKSGYVRSFQSTTPSSVLSVVFVFPDYRNREVINEIVHATGSGIVAPRIGYNSIVLKENKTFKLYFAKKNVFVVLIAEEANSKQQALDLARIMANRI